MSWYSEGLAVKLGQRPEYVPQEPLRPSRPARSQTGSVLLPESQEKRILKRVSHAQEDVRALEKSIRRTGRNVSFALGASAIATTFLGGVMIAGWGKKKGQR